MMLPFSRPADGHEAWFRQHYADLQRWALRLADGDRDAAEDLVHDLFVHIMAGRPDLDAIESPQAYFYKSLRNLHLSNARRRARHQEMVVGCIDVDVLEHASLRAGLHHLEHGPRAANRRAEFQHQLRAVWRYAQLRKASSKTAGVLILRFFHGYYPEEIALILRTSRDAVDELLSQARKEARRFLAGCEADGEAGRAAGWPADGLLDAPDLAKTLHDAALRSDPDGTCLDDEDVALLYPPGDRGSSLPLATVAHVVSCRACLSRVTRRLDLPPLAERHPLDSLGYDRERKPPHDSSGGGFGGGFGGGVAGKSGPRPRQRLGAGRRRLADLLAHTPKELRVAVNGVVLGSQQVTSTVSRQTLRLATPAADFVEIFSERDVRMLFMNLDAPPQGPVEAYQAVTLNDGRRLEVHVDFLGETPIVHVSYVDPALVPLLAPALVPPALSTPSSRVSRWLSRLLGRRGRHYPRWRLSRGGAFTTLVVATLVGALLVSQLGRPVLSAAELLDKAAAADAAGRADAAHAVYRAIEVETHARETGAITRRRVEEWRSAARGLTVRRAYDERQRLVAGEWIQANGRRTVHRAAAAATDEPIADGLAAWQIDPSAASFLGLARTVEHATVTRADGRFRIALDAADGPDGLVAASLTLREDGHVLEQRATVRASGGTTDVVWTERSWFLHPAETVPATIFEIDPTLSPRAAAPEAPPARVIPPATPGLELAALTALHRIDADLGGEVRVRRAGGRLEVTGVVVSAARRGEIQAALAEVARHAAVQVRIDTVAGMRARGRRAQLPLASAGAPPLAFGLRRMPAHETIRAYLLQSGVAAERADDDVARVANRVVQQAAQMRVHAWALRDLLERFPPAVTADLDDNGRRQWRVLVGDHGRAFAAEATVLRAILAPMLPSPAAAEQPPDHQDADADPRRLGGALVAAAADLDRQLAAAFTVPDAGAEAAPLDAGRVWAVLARATTLGTSLSRLSQ